MKTKKQIIEYFTTELENLSFNTTHARMLKDDKLIINLENKAEIIARIAIYLGVPSLELMKANDKGYQSYLIESKR